MEKAIDLPPGAVVKTVSIYKMCLEQCLKDTCHSATKVTIITKSITANEATNASQLCFTLHSWGPGVGIYALEKRMSSSRKESS